MRGTAITGLASRRSPCWRIANRKLRTGLKNPLICMTNIGVLDAARLSFGDLRPTDAYLCGSIKYKPYFQLAMSSYQDELTLSVNLYGSASDRARILSFSRISMRNCRRHIGGGIP